MDTENETWFVGMKCQTCNAAPARKHTLLCKSCEAKIPIPCNECYSPVHQRGCVRCKDCHLKWKIQETAKRQQVHEIMERDRIEKANQALIRQQQLRQEAIARIASDMVQQPYVFAERFLRLEEAVNYLLRR